MKQIYEDDVVKHFARGYDKEEERSIHWYTFMLGVNSEKALQRTLDYIVRGIVPNIEE